MLGMARRSSARRRSGQAMGYARNGSRTWPRFSSTTSQTQGDADRAYRCEACGAHIPLSISNQGYKPEFLARVLMSEFDETRN